MVTLLNIGGALCKSSLFPFLVPRRKVWLMPADEVPCSNAANTGERKTWTESEFCSGQNFINGQKSPKMYISVLCRNEVKVTRYCAKVTFVYFLLVTK